MLFETGLLDPKATAAAAAAVGLVDEAVPLTVLPNIAARLAIDPLGNGPLSGFGTGGFAGAVANFPVVVVKGRGGRLVMANEGFGVRVDAIDGVGVFVRDGPAAAFVLGVILG